MKKSEQYRVAQLAVLRADLQDEDKMEIVRTLQEQEDFSVYVEKKEAEAE